MQIKDQEISEMEHSNLPQDVPTQADSVDQSRRRFTKSGAIVSGVLLTLASRPSLGGGTGGGGGIVCKAPSGFMSGNLSHQGKKQGNGGYPCQYWINNCSSWVNCDRSKSFCSEFNFNNNGSSSYGCKVVYNFSNYQGTKYSKTTTGTYVQYTLLDMLCRYHVGHYPTGTNSNCDITRDYRGNISNSFYSNGNCGNITSYRPITEYSALDQLGQNCVAAILNCRAGYTPFLPESTVKDMYNSCRTKGTFQPTAGVYWTASDCVNYLKSTQNCTYYS